MGKWFALLFVATFLPELCCAYFQMSKYRLNLLTDILTNSKVKNDFKTISHDDAFQLTSFWYEETKKIEYCETTNANQGVEYLYRPNRGIFENTDRLLDLRYDISKTKSQKDEHTYMIWRPKIQILIPYMHSSYENCTLISKPTLYPSFRETFYLLRVDRSDREYGVNILNIVKSPFWLDEKYNSLELMKSSLNKYLVSYLKYPQIYYVCDI